MVGKQRARREEVKVRKAKVALRTSGDKQWMFTDKFRFENTLKGVIVLTAVTSMLSTTLMSLTIPNVLLPPHVTSHAPPVVATQIAGIAEIMETLKLPLKAATTTVPKVETQSGPETSTKTITPGKTVKATTASVLETDWSGLLTLEDLQVKGSTEAIELATYLLKAKTGYKDETLVEMLSKIVTNEIGGLTDSIAISSTRMEEAAVVWCILNRAAAAATDEINEVSADNGAVRPKEWVRLIVRVAKAKNQFAYSANTKIHKDIPGTVEDVLIRWSVEQTSSVDIPANIIGRVLPKDYLWFTGDGKHNTYTDKWPGSRSAHRKWNWCLPDPYIVD